MIIQKGFKIAVLLLSTLATSLSFARARDPITKAEMMKRLNEVHMPTVSFAVRPEEKFVASHGECKEYSFSLPVVAENDYRLSEQTINVYRPPVEDFPGKRMTVVMLPTLGGRGIVENTGAQTLCSAGFVAIIADVNHPILPEVYPEWGLEDRHNRNSLLVLQTLMDWADGDKQIDAHRVGMFGASLGAVIGALWVGVEPRLKAALLVVGGSNFPEMLRNSDVSTFVELREKRMAAMHTNDPAVYEEAIHKSVRYDSVYFAPLRKAKVKMITGTADTSVPYANQLQLWKAFGEGDIYTNEGGSHVSTIADWVFWGQSNTVDWFKAAMK